MKSYVLPVPPVLEQCAVDLWDLLCSVINLYNLKQEVFSVFRFFFFFFFSVLKKKKKKKNVNRETQCNWPAVLDHYLKRSLLSGRAMVRAWGPMQPNDPAFRLRATKLRSVFERYLAEYEDDAWAHPFDAYEGLSDDEIRSFGYAEGALQTVDSFKEKAEETARQLMLKDTPLAELEQLYWNILESRDTRMVVEYANDLSVVTYGSGFPRDEHEPMSRHPWNLNVLPKLPSSLFHHAKEVIHGVTDPMLYFGGVFTSFAWHVEDHFLYSINYHHGGAPKVWYGVGSDHAEALERAMKAELPELFDRHPDLLHQLVTMLSPAALVRRGVPVCTAVQEPGDFVITFPRGYHSGWNAGFNLAEAVNFAMPDWLVWGVRSLDNYIKTRRMCAFSHEELILSCAQSFPVSYVARHLLQELYRLTLNYDELRRRVHVGGVRLMFKAEKCGDILHCTKCLADCYFACIQCHCSKQERVCLRCCNEGRVDWCTGHCQGLFLFERVPMEVLESLIQKLETRLTLPAICSLRRSESVDIFSAQLNYVNRVSAKGAAGVTSKAVSLDIPMARPASLRSKLARRGGVMSLTPQQEATLRCPDSAAVRLPTLFFVEDRLRIRRRVEGVAKAVFADHSPALIPPRNEDSKHHHYLSHQSASSSGNPESDDVLVKASPAKETSAKRTAPEDDSATRLMPSPRADTKRRVVIDLTCDD